MFNTAIASHFRFPLNTYVDLCSLRIHIAYPFGFFSILIQFGYMPPQIQREKYQLKLNVALSTKFEIMKNDDVTIVCA